MEFDVGDILAAAVRGAVFVGLVAAGVYLGVVWGMNHESGNAAIS